MLVVFFLLQLKLFLFIEIPQIVISLSILSLGRIILTVQELATGFFFQVKLFLFREIPQIVIYLSILSQGKMFRSLTVQEGESQAYFFSLQLS